MAPHLRSGRFNLDASVRTEPKRLTASYYFYMGIPAGEKGVLCLAGNSASYLATVLCRSRMTPSRHHVVMNQLALLRQIGASFDPAQLCGECG